ncbi:DUF2306 domain-containing protein [Kitasatospora sp. NBC_01287]|uniref:DUF2306 domain-containing protein n=1 Tax=Kitasatospora sp. NBC_01287 TaxID=2903573 RepID=UPI00225B8C31|nr:DUF2306 domain-containing protein [Kitasatospora sp. NBC_01287]MCX4745757.1 DUF2306 domain-containing protein [Kitasatospora sp. NBC_01287]
MASSRPRRAGWVAVTVPATLTSLVAARYFSLDPATFLAQQRAVYVAHLVPLLFHVGGGILALTLGPWQFSRRLRAGRPAVHRVLGRLYLLGAAAAGIGGLLMAPTALAAPAAPLGFAVLAVLLLATSTAATVTIRRREIVRHRIWMTRSYALIFSAVTFRLLLVLLPALGMSFNTAYGSGAWAAWVIDLLVAERLTAGLRGRRAGGGRGRRGGERRGRRGDQQDTRVPQQLG